MGLNFISPDPLLPSSCVCPVAEDIGCQPQAYPRPVSGFFHVSLAGQQTEYPSRDTMSAPITEPNGGGGKRGMLDIRSLIYHSQISCDIVVK